MARPEVVEVSPMGMVTLADGTYRVPGYVYTGDKVCDTCWNVWWYQDDETASRKKCYCGRKVQTVEV